jgi:glutamine amidotransferase-like uncharacterized protein
MPSSHSSFVAPQVSGWSRPGRAPRIGIFTGEGSSHSWLWFVETFERMGLTDLRFFDVSEIAAGRLQQNDILAVSGGDTIAIASALGLAGAREMHRFIENGGLYIGSCAGAYLVMHSSKPHLNLFNFAGVKITNLSKKLPQCRRLSHKFAMAYGCDYVFHPVRGPVRLSASVGFASPGRQTLEAPLYGGPGMIASPETEVLARYLDFTDKTAFLVDEDIARETLLDRAAAVRARMGNGTLVLFGPHFEHPHFTAANRFVGDVISEEWDAARVGRLDSSQRGYDRGTASVAPWIKDLKRELSNSRIVALGLEMTPVRWLIGNKVYEPEKIRVFLEAMWKRVAVLEKRGAVGTDTDAVERLVAGAGKITARLRSIKQRLDDGEDTRKEAARMFSLLNRCTTDFLDMYYQSICEPG